MADGPSPGTNFQPSMRSSLSPRATNPSPRSLPATTAHPPTRFSAPDHRFTTSQGLGIPQQNRKSAALPNSYTLTRETTDMVSLEVCETVQQMPNMIAPLDRCSHVQSSRPTTLRMSKICSFSGLGGLGVVKICDYRTKLQTWSNKPKHKFCTTPTSKPLYGRISPMHSIVKSLISPTKH